MSNGIKLRAIVTGASSGIGESIAKELAQRGHSLFLVARREERLQSLKKTLTEQYKVDVDCLSLDLAKAGSAERLFQQATANGKAVQVLINNAGIGPYGNFLAAELDKHLETLALNNQVLTELCYRFSAHMLEQKEPCYMMNVASVASFQGTKKFAVYSASKSYVLIFSEILAAELSETNVHVSCLCPGGTYTEFLDKNGQLLKEAGKNFMMSSEAVAKTGVQEMFAKRRVIVPGFLNQVMCVVPRLLPRGLALTLASKSHAASVGEKK